MSLVVIRAGGEGISTYHARTRLVDKEEVEL